MRYQLSSGLVLRGEEPRVVRSRIPHHLHTRHHAAAVLREETEESGPGGLTLETERPLMMPLQREEGLMSHTFRAFGIAGAEAHVRPPTRAREETLQVFLNQGSCSRMICCVSCTCTMRAPVEFSSPLAWRMQPGLTHAPHSADSIELAVSIGVSVK